MAEPASKQSIEQLMAATGAADLGQQMMSQMLPAMKQAMPDAPAEFWTEFQAQANVDKLMADIVPIYQKYLSAEDVKAISAFYNSEAGKKLVQVQPQLMQESMLAGQAWGQAAAMRAMEKVKANAETKAAQ